MTEGSSNRRYVWYPISQCLISKHDRRAVYRFFYRNNLTPFSNLSDHQLEEHLHYWCMSGGGSVKIKRYLSNESYKRSILNQVKSLLMHWDGEIPPDEESVSKKHATASINVELRFNPADRVEVRYWFPRRGRGETNCETNPLGIKHLQISSLERWFQSIIDTRGLFWNLSNRLELQTTEAKPIVYTLGRSHIWVFRRDTERDDSWLSQRNMQLYEEHLIVFREELVEQVSACLNQTCVIGDEEPKFIYDDWVYLRAKPTKLLSFSEQDLWRLSVVYSKQIRFIGGLWVQDQHGRRAYLNICLPTVFVPDLGLASEECLRINGQMLAVGANRLVKLKSTMALGVHQISYGSQTRELRVITPKRSLEYDSRTLTAALSESSSKIPTYSVRRTAEISAESGMWLAGAKLLGTGIPEITWDDMQIEPSIPQEDRNLSFKSPAEFISLVVKAAIELKQDKALVPKWLGQAIEYIDQNVVLRSLVQKKLGHYHEKALSYADLRKQGSR